LIDTSGLHLVKTINHLTETTFESVPSHLESAEINIFCIKLLLEREEYSHKGVRYLDKMLLEISRKELF